jgi:hypothetical protein
VIGKERNQGKERKMREENEERWRCRKGKERDRDTQ